MSYRFNIRKDDAGLHIDNLSGELPDGEWEVFGHEDEGGRSVGVTRFTPAPSRLQVATANGYSNRVL